MSDLILSIDAGTTGIKALVVASDSNVVGRAYSEFSQSFPQPGWVEHDAEEIWDTTVSVVNEAIQDAGVAAKDLAGIGITDQRETTVLWDRSSGNPWPPRSCGRTGARPPSAND